ncbi:MAG TPA: hypothetical protein VKY89_01740 [Thermoanaerobaculia bacterium]|jgi:hypothetical protein|nr:hypothetical protein [Thermoanaerobaculia bacterium]
MPPEAAEQPAGRAGGGRALGILALTHSSRKTNLARCSVQFLTRRFGDPGRLRDLPPFDQLPPAAALYSGAASFYRVLADERRGVKLVTLGSLRGRDRIQHVALRGAGELLVGYEHRLERFRLRAPIDRLRRLAAADLEPAGRLDHPHLAGLHTVEPLPDGRVAVACADADAVLLCDLERGTVERTLRLPAALYGEGYPLSADADTDLRRHAIPDEAQATHLNAAHGAGASRLVVSTLIQGAIGTFDLASGAYAEISRGFVGCHGARLSAAGEIYFADSACGTLTFLTTQGGIARRFATGSRWLHDVQQLAGDLYAFALADCNELRIYDIGSDQLLWRRRFATWPLPGLFSAARHLPGWLGNSTQALSFHLL